MRKKILLIMMVVIKSFAVFGQAPGWVWAKNAGGIGSDQSKCVAVDLYGNSYLTGYFMAPSISFGGITLSNTDNTGVTYDIFIAKFDALGNVLWAHGANGTDLDYSNSVTVDVFGNSYITGSFKSPTITFGPITLSNTVSNGSSRDLFLVKYDSLGNVLWAKSAGGNNYDSGRSIKVDVFGNVYITGEFSSNSINFGSTLITCAGSDDIFIVKYDSSGSIIWSKSAGGSGADNASSITVDSFGNSYVAGGFLSSSIVLGSTTVVNSMAGVPDIIVIKYDAFGNVVWAKRAGGTDYDAGYEIITNGNGDLYLIGYFMSSSITFGNITLTNAGNSDIFIVKYDNSGNILWANGVGGTYSDIGYSITLDLNGNPYITGYFSSNTITFGNITLINAGVANIFVVKYNSFGNVLWANRIGGNSNDQGKSIAVDANSSIYIAGIFASDTINIGNIALIKTVDISWDFFVAKAGITTSVSEQTIPSNPITLYPNPTTSQININSFYTIDKIEIADVIGQVVYGATPHQKNVVVLMERGGIYFVSLTSKDQTVTKKVVVQR